MNLIIKTLLFITISLAVKAREIRLPPTPAPRPTVNFDQVINTGKQNVGTVIIISESSDSSEYATEFCPLGKDNENADQNDNEWKPFINNKIPNYFERRRNYHFSILQTLAKAQQQTIPLISIPSLLSQRIAVEFDNSFFLRMNKLSSTIASSESLSEFEKINGLLEVAQITKSICLAQNQRLINIRKDGTILASLEKFETLKRYCRLNHLLLTNSPSLEENIKLIIQERLLTALQINQTPFQDEYLQTISTNPNDKINAFKSFYRKCLDILNPKIRFETIL